MQEGHTAHATAAEAEAEAMQMIRIYEEFAVNVAAMPVVAGRKSRIESFAGADVTYTIEAMMGDQRALQVGYQGARMVCVLVLSTTSRVNIDPRGLGIAGGRAPKVHALISCRHSKVI